MIHKPKTVTLKSGELLTEGTAKYHFYMAGRLMGKQSTGHEIKARKLYEIETGRVWPFS